MRMNTILALATANLVAAQGNGTVLPDEATSTVTATSTNLITTCPPGGACHATAVAPASTACPEATAAVHQKVVCYGDECWDEQPCDHCPKLRVICVEGYCYVEECETADYNRLVICEGEHCDYASGHNQKVVCYGEVCEIEECHGVECEEKIINHEACTGEHCPKPAPPAGPPAPPAPPAPVCPGPDCHEAPPAPPAGPVCPGPDCHEAPPAPPAAPPAAPVCPGPDCQTPPAPPAHPCPGPDCQVMPPKGNNGTIPPVHAGAGSVLPGAGALFGLVAGFAALL